MNSATWQECLEELRQQGKAFSIEQVDTNTVRVCIDLTQRPMWLKVVVTETWTEALERDTTASRRQYNLATGKQYAELLTHAIYYSGRHRAVSVLAITLDGQPVDLSRVDRIAYSPIIDNG